eukprot:14963305-Alexandrium_andersonii.AAC.1
MEDAFSTTTCTRRSVRHALRSPATTGTTKKSDERDPHSPATPPVAPEVDRSWHGDPATTRT